MNIIVSSLNCSYLNMIFWNILDLAPLHADIQEAGLDLHVFINAHLQDLQGGEANLHVLAQDLDLTMTNSITFSFFYHFNHIFIHLCRELYI